MIVFVNEKQQEIVENTSLAFLINEMNIPPQGTAIAVNDTVIPYRKWSEYVLSEGDTITVIRATQGG